MSNPKTFTYVSLKTNKEVAQSMCAQLPIILISVNSVEELFPLLSDSKYNTDFVAISIDMFEKREDQLDMFDIIHTLAILIKSTVYRPSIGSKPQKRNTKIFVVVDADTDPKLIREVMSYPDIVTIGWTLSSNEDYQSVADHLERIISGDYSIHPRVAEMLKPKKKKIVQKNDLNLTVRQSQVLHLVQDRGASNKTIAKILGITESTVKLHMGTILKKYGVKNRTQLAVFSRDKN